MRAYRAILEAGDESGYGVVFPELPGCISVGETREAALRNAAEALQLHLEGLEADGIPFPEPRRLDAPLPSWLTDGIPPYRETERVSIAPKP